MMNTYGRLGESCQARQKESPGDGWSQTFENKERPTPEHVLNHLNMWVIPTLIDLTDDEIREKRKQRYQAETDDLLVAINSMEMQGEDTAEIKAEWLNKISQIKKDLPFSNGNIIQSHYNALTPPTS